MTSAQVVETSVNVITNSPSQDYTHPDDRTLLYDMTPGFKPFTTKRIVISKQLGHYLPRALKCHPHLSPPVQPVSENKHTVSKLSNERTIKS